MFIFTTLQSWNWRKWVFCSYHRWIFGFSLIFFDRIIPKTVLECQALGFLMFFMFLLSPIKEIPLEMGGKRVNPEQKQTFCTKKMEALEWLFYQITRVWLNGLKIWKHHWIPREELIEMEYSNVWKVDFYFSSNFIKTKMEE